MTVVRCGRERARLVRLGRMLYNAAAMDGFGSDLVVRTKLLLPRTRRYLLQRPGLTARLRDAQFYRLTVVQASTGYGKSTALVAALRDAPVDLCWYSITESDRDPLLFLLHLVYALRMRWPDLGDRALGLMQSAGANPQLPQMVIEAVANEMVGRSGGPALLVLDDFHLVNSAPPVCEIMDHLIAILPPAWHVVIATRQRPALAGLNRWHVTGELLRVGQQELALSAAEIAELFRAHYRLPLGPAQVQRLARETEGWVIAVQMIGQRLSGAPAGQTLDQILDELPRTLEELFVYLAQDVLGRQPEAVRHFLLYSAVLRQLDPAACDALLGWRESARLLRELDENDFFLVRQGDVYRYHHLFHDFLRQQLAERLGTDVGDLQRSAAGYFEEQGRFEEAIYHRLQAAEHEQAAALMARLSPVLVRDGRFDTLSEWVAALPLPVLEQFPALMVEMGELCRFSSRFEEALAWYEQAQERYLARKEVAGACRALRGQAAVYLDTVRPIKAESLLQEALHLVDGQPDREEQAQLLDLLAENMTNRGRWERADELRQQSRSLREEGHGAADRGVRVLLRTGRLDEALEVLHERAAAELRDPQGEHFREPRAHRETQLVMALIYAWQGEADRALTCARAGLRIGRRLNSPFVEAVGHMRRAHAWQISALPDASQRAASDYARAIEIAEEMAVARTKVEAHWGLCRLHGVAGDLPAAERHAHEGIELGERAGDEWIVAHIRLMLGASYVLAGGAHLAAAGEWLQRAYDGMGECGDPFGQAAALLWRCLLLQARGEPLEPLATLLELVEANHYRFLFERTSFAGLPDPAILPGLLIAGRQEGLAAAGRMLEQIGLPADLDTHPGYTLRVEMLGRFAVYRGRERVQESEWQRDKARLLFQLLLAHRGQFLPREQIAAELWPEADSAAAESQFKVTLNALQHTLEPNRPPRAPALFVQRRGAAYGLNPAAPLLMDAAELERLVARADADADASGDAERALEGYLQALATYEGDLLPDCLYEDWCREERERLRRLVLHAADRAAAGLLARGGPGDAESAIRVARQGLQVDDCHEQAHRHLIQAYLQLGNRVQALRACEQCAAVLRAELGVEMAPETVAVCRQAQAS